MPGAWHCSGISNDALIDNLVASRLLTSPRAVGAFRAVDRAHFVQNVRDAYVDSPSYIGESRPARSLRDCLAEELPLCTKVAALQSPPLTCMPMQLKTCCQP